MTFLCSFDIQRVYFNSLIRKFKAYANNAENVNKDSPIGYNEIVAEIKAGSQITPQMSKIGLPNYWLFSLTTFLKSLKYATICVKFGTSWTPKEISRVLRPGSKVCSENMNDWQYLSLGDLEQNEFFPKSKS